MGHDLSGPGGAARSGRCLSPFADGPTRPEQHPTRHRPASGRRWAPPLCAILLALVFAWGAYTLPWGTGPSLAWLGFLLAAIHLWAAWALWAGHGPSLRWALRLGSACLVTLLLGVGWGVTYLVDRFGSLGRSLSAGAVLIVLPLAALSLPAGWWLQRKIRLLEGNPQLEDQPRQPQSKPGWGSIRTWFAGLVALGAPCLVAWPATWTEGDSFPLSSYPMFAHPRPTASFVRLTAEPLEGKAQRVPVQSLFPGEPLQARVLLRMLMEQPSSPSWCEKLRERKALGVPQLAGVEAVRLERQHVAPLAYFRQGPQAGRVQTLGRCQLANAPRVPP